MTVVDEMTPEILEKVKTKLLSFLDEGVSAARKEYGVEYFERADSMMPTTTPARCIS
jgi:hypothetical protein